MKSLFISVIAVCSALMLAAASYVPASTLSAPDPKYGVVDASFAVETIPGNASSTIILNGTVQEVYQQLHEANPDYMDLLNNYWASNPSMTSPDTLRSLESVEM
ncbi:hypothetical protein F5883DRAFT_641050 [Diaporthe sp. PMI_573]|nr:hypothetical protein F5883DRAFT_641050 [Diaporthaceae sp. PMI_573]